MKKYMAVSLVVISLALVSCDRMRGKYRCVFNCGCRDRNIIHELEFISSSRVIISDAVDKRTAEYRLNGKRVELLGDDKRGSITVLDKTTLIIQGADCLSGTYRKIE